MDGISSLGQLIVHYSPGAAPILTKSEHAKASISVGRRWITLHDAEDIDVEATVEKFRKRPEVYYVEANHQVTYSFKPNDTYFPGNGKYNSSRNGLIDQWGLTAIDAPTAWDVTHQRASDVVIAIIDTGVDSSHPDLSARMLRDSSGKIIGYNSLTNTSNAEDDNGHGTHVAGIASGVTNNKTGIAGVAFATARIMPIKALDAQGSGSDYSVSQAIVWAADHGAKIISMSLGSPAYSQTMQLAINYAWMKGCLIVAAAGNDGTEMLNYPAACNLSLGIGSTNSSGAVSSFSNSGRHVDCVAPGSDYLSTMPTYPVYLTTQYGFKQNYDALSGTSMATPVASGLLALMWATYPEATNEQLQILLTQTTTKLAGDSKGWNKTDGYGQVQAGNALLKKRQLSGLGCITGQVVDAMGLPVAKARASVGNISYLTDNDGIFRLANLTTSENAVLKVSAPLPSGVKTITVNTRVPDNADNNITVTLK